MRSGTASRAGPMEALVIHDYQGSKLCARSSTGIKSISYEISRPLGADNFRGCTANFEGFAPVVFLGSKEPGQPRWGRPAWRVPGRQTPPPGAKRSCRAGG